MPLSQALVKELLDYDPITGALTWRHRARKWFNSDRAQKSWNTRRAGKVAGSVDISNGYVEIGILGEKYWLHRVAFLYVNGYMPDFVDHDNGARDVNVAGNLNEATRSSNARNSKRRADNASGATGVYWHRGAQKWMVCIGSRYVGLFANFADAVAARKAEERASGYHPNHGRA